MALLVKVQFQCSLVIYLVMLIPLLRFTQQSVYIRHGSVPIRISLALSRSSSSLLLVAFMHYLTACLELLVAAKKCDIRQEALLVNVESSTLDTRTDLEIYFSNLESFWEKLLEVATRTKRVSYIYIASMFFTSAYSADRYVECSKGEKRLTLVYFGGVRRYYISRLYL